MPNKAAKAMQYALPPAIVGGMGSQDPVDYATMYGSLRNAVPLSLLFHSGSLNENEDEELRKIYGPDGFYARRPGTDLQPKMQNPGPNALSQAMNRMELYGQNPNFDSLTPEQKARVIKNFVDSKAMNSELRYQKGGEVKKVVREEVIDPARRALFGLRAKPAMEQLPAVLRPPTAPMPTAADLFGAAASVPISRRSLMQSALGQAVRGALPELGGLSPMGTVAKAVESAVNPASSAATASGIPGMIAAGLSAGLRDEDIVKLIMETYRQNSPLPSRVERMVDSIKDPTSIVFEEPVGAGRAMMDMIGVEGSPLANREAMRYMRHVAPDKYDEIRQTAKDVAEYGFNE
jgi:hypothetical protein